MVESERGVMSLSFVVSTFKHQLLTSWHQLPVFRSSLTLNYDDFFRLNFLSFVGLMNSSIFSRWLRNISVGL